MGGLLINGEDSDPSANYGLPGTPNEVPKPGQVPRGLRNKNF